MTEDFYCEEVFSGKTKVNKVLETENVLAYHHTKPFYPVHIVAVPKKHISSLITLNESDNDLLLELLGVIKKVATNVTEEHGACRVITNLGNNIFIGTSYLENPLNRMYLFPLPGAFNILLSK